MVAGADRDPKAQEELGHALPESIQVTGYYRQCEYCQASVNLIHTTTGCVEIYQDGFVTYIKPHHPDCDRPRDPEPLATVSVEFEDVPKEVMDLLTGRNS